MTIVLLFSNDKNNTIMKTNKPIKVISHIDLSKGKTKRGPLFAHIKMTGINITIDPQFKVKDFSELNKQERRRHSRQVNRVNAKVALFHKEYFRYIYLMLKSIF